MSHRDEMYMCVANTNVVSLYANESGKSYNFSVINIRDIGVQHD